MSENKSENKNRFQSTLNLPKTDFSIRANAAQTEAEILNKWNDINIFEKSFSKNEGKKKYILHDGPPYANGNIHLGHVLNKVLKDFVTKFKRMSGFHTPVIPGWDCHGLPIEIKVMSENSALKDAVEIKKACRKYASKWLEIQKEEFKNLGILMNWENRYCTMDESYEADILRAFAKFIEFGYIERKGKTVPWCASCKTVLASAEIEYEDRKDPSIYVFFPFEQETAKKIFSNILKKEHNLNINLLVWTTTPWTLPLNRAVCLNSNAKYVLLKDEQQDKAAQDRIFIIASELADKICTTLGIEKKVLAEFDSALLNKACVKHPFIENLSVPIILDNSVLLNEGTACVHSAPGCGPEDYIIAIKNGLEIFSPISSEGKYQAEIEPKELENMSVADGQIWVIKKLAELGMLRFKTSIKHSYPHCWRCHNGLIFRATDQWFCDLQRNNLVKDCLKQIEKIDFIPEWGKARLTAFVSNRTEWCISRQRVWGVPIPAILCEKCGQAYLSAQFVSKVADKVEKSGVEYWDSVTIEQLIQEQILSKNFKCSNCANQELNQFKKEKDILDVWFDSGISHFAVLSKNKNLAFPADIYLEGSDQHRGWFQSSLLSSMVINKSTCTKSFLTHGFLVDEKGHKMSKSLGNVINPEDIIKKFSRDILRLWVASSDYTGDIAISEKILNNIAEVYRKIRNTCRFMISNLYDFDINKNSVPFDKLLKIDQFAIINLNQLSNKILLSYEKHDFSAVFHDLNNYCANDLSALYLDICKDRLYVEKPDGLERRSAQTAVYYILDILTRLMAPILSFLAEEVALFYKNDIKNSIHLNNFVQLKACLNLTDNYLKCEKNSKIWDLLIQLRQIVLKAIEIKRVEEIIKHSLEAKVKIYLKIDSAQKELLDLFIKELKTSGQDTVRFFKDWFIVSQFEFVQSCLGLDETGFDWICVKVEHADGHKCPRCWQWEESTHKDLLCTRCAKVLEF